MPNKIKMNSYYKFCLYLLNEDTKRMLSLVQREISMEYMKWIANGGKNGLPTFGREPVENPWNKTEFTSVCPNSSKTMNSQKHVLFVIVHTFPLKHTSPSHQNLFANQIKQEKPVTQKLWFMREAVLNHQIMSDTKINFALWS